MAGTLPIAPLRLEAGEHLAWHAETDLLVVGFGGAGACAALEARERGLEVLALDRFAGGGATARSGGVVYAGGGTPYQREAGYSDDAEAMFTQKSAPASSTRCSEAVWFTQISSDGGSVDSESTAVADMA